MCSRQEFLFRQKSCEISIFEATQETASRPPSKRHLDPTKAVKKYRRSAAGTSKEQQYPPRNLESLLLTVDYLASLLTNWQTLLREITQQDARRQQTNAAAVSLLDVVNFVEDRLRAVQVDLVVSQKACQQLQYKIAKIHILSLYLLLDSPKYERKHGSQALHTALSSYWYGNGAGGDDNDKAKARSESTNDKILALTALIQLNDDLSHLDAHPDGTFTFGTGIMPVYRKHIGMAGTTTLSALPLFQWSLRVVVACNLGEWYKALWLLKDQQEQQQQPTDGTFGTLARCCMAPSLTRIRAKALQAYNASFMKSERLAIEEVSRLLYIADVSLAAELCAMLGLPVEEAATKVAFKTNTIQMTWNNKQRHDPFVFSKNVEHLPDREGISVPDSSTLALLLGG